MNWFPVPSAFQTVETLQLFSIKIYFIAGSIILIAACLVVMSEFNNAAVSEICSESIIESLMA